MKAITLEQTPSAEKKPGLQWVPIELIVPSTTNPRVTRTAEKDQELLESVRERNVTQAGLIRPVTATKEHVRILESFTSPTMGISKLKAQFKPGDDIFQLIGGQRRWEASVKSGKLDYPAQIRAMADGEVLEYQVIENDDREDLHDMDRAAAYRRLYDEWKKDTTLSVTERVKALAARMKRKPRTVWNLISLGNLTEQGQRMLREGMISPSHAYEIAARPQSQQNRVLQWVKQQIDWSNRVSVRDLKDFIKRECDHFLDSASFPKADASLLPAAGAGYVLILSTRDEYSAPKGAKPAEEWKEVKQGSCQYAFLGVIEDGKNPGKEVYACASTNLCKTHWGRGSGSSRPEPARPRSEAEKKAMLQKQRNRKLDEAYRTLATSEFRKHVSTLKIEDLREVAMAMAYMTDSRHRNPIFKAMGWKASNSM